VCETGKAAFQKEHLYYTTKTEGKQVEGYYLFEYLCGQLNNMGEIKEARMDENGFIRIRAVMDEGPEILVEGGQNVRVQS
jgi:hypothetical protein